MTEKELQEALEQAQSENAALLKASDDTMKQLQDLTAERDSLKEELTSNKESLVKIQEELQNTKKLNFTLARSIDQGASGADRQPEDILKEMFIGGGK